MAPIPVIMPAAGEVIDAESLGGADLHCRQSGVSDYLAHDEPEALHMARESIKALGLRQAQFRPEQAPRAPLYPSEQLYGLAPTDLRKPVEVREIIARKLLIDLGNMNVPAGTEFLDTIIPQYIADCISWGAIGARTTESQLHRELCSGLSMPIGFKNSTTGNVAVAVDAVTAAKHPHHFLGVTKHGISAIVSTKGNDSCHIILRGGQDGPNYEADHIEKAVEGLNAMSVPPYVMVDCSHGNSRKDYTKQPVVAADLCEQIAAGQDAIRGIMLESHLHAGNQKYQPGEKVKYGISITDACIDWETTESVLRQCAAAIKARRAS